MAHAPRPGPGGGAPFPAAPGRARCPRVSGLPRRTTVERAVGDHLRAGGHWYVWLGWSPP
ncbi:hypothetical protein C1J00_32920 [Streptomyces cahuitamycinicus]|uniref:GNAT-like C-terminal domain-containing protein n=1 Tax=Streptomyces cahuitamycinicus TaxID=2070367 RepID=A0A2N8TGM4_9ACTN|nr:hypothetical protein C1J00_32920 [Streptomyces cahuitamycinicus]